MRHRITGAKKIPPPTGTGAKKGEESIGRGERGVGGSVAV